MEKTQAAVGEALTMWEQLETTFAFLFSALVSGSPSNTVALRAYGAVRTFEGRAEMLKEAGFAYFGAYSAPEGEAALKNLLRAAREFGSRRNDIAHGMVTALEWVPPIEGSATEERGWCVVPAFYISNRHDMNHVPDYVYTSAEMHIFSRRWSVLSYLVRSLTDYLTADLLSSWPGRYQRQDCK